MPAVLQDTAHIQAVANPPPVLSMTGTQPQRETEPAPPAPAAETDAPTALTPDLGGGNPARTLPFGAGPPEVEVAGAAPFGGIAAAPIAFGAYGPLGALPPAAFGGFVPPAIPTGLAAQGGPTQLLVNDIEDLPVGVVQTLRNISLQVDQGENMYGIRQVPTAADWGRGVHDRVLCYDKRPVIVRMAGRLRYHWFYDLKGNPQPRINMGVALNVEGDHQAVEELYTRARPRGTVDADLVYASRLQNTRKRGSAAVEAVVFQPVYDATAGLLAKNLLPRITPSDFANNDIVIIECNFTRWRKPGEAKKRTWSTWDVGFDVQNITLLHVSP